MNESQAIDLVRKTCALRHLSYVTEKTYVGWLKRYCRFLSERGLAFTSTESRIEGYLSSMAQADVSASTQNQAFNALLFFYRECLGQQLANINALRAKKPSFVRYAPSVAEVAALLREVQDSHGYPTRLLTHLLYGCGMRVSEPISLRIRDVDLENSQITIRQAKGGKDRVVALPCSLAKPMRDQIAAARVLWQQDQANGVPVKLPHQMACKAPRLATAWAWFWVFPLRTVSRDPRSGDVVRWHCLDQQIQRAVRAASDRIGAPGVVTPHSLRHAFATHAMQQGAFVRDVQHVLGHASLETTMGYLHAEAGRVTSPLDRCLDACYS